MIDPARGQRPLTNSDLVALENRDSSHPIRQIGNIQPYGILLVLQFPQFTIVQVSANTQDSLGLPPDALLGQPLTALFERAEVEHLKHCLSETAAPLQSFLTASLTGQAFDANVYKQSDSILIELEPHPQTAASSDHLHHLISDTIAALKTAATLAELVQILVREIQALTGFDRVMVYQFEPDQSGVVIAEANVSDRESYLGLHYPATDIPSESRSLFQENSLRFIPDINYQPIPLVPAENPLTQAPLDLSPVWLRGVAPPHVTYLQNMGVAGSMTISLIDDQGLWGLISCHHYQPKFLNKAMRTTFTVLAKVANLELMYHQGRVRSAYQGQNRELLAQLRMAIDYTEDAVLQTLTANAHLLLTMFQAEGIALVLDQEYELIGTTPSQTAVADLVAWLLTQNPDQIFVTQQLATAYPASQHWPVKVAGLLAISIALQKTHPVSYHILLFRPEQLRTVQWAGDLNDCVEINEAGELQLCPRNSFQLWKELVRDQSLPWSVWEQEAAIDLRGTLMLAVLKFATVALEATAQRAEVANQAKSEFLANMSHEIRTPMNAVLGFTDLLQSITRDPVAQDYLEAISSSSKTLLSLINDILDLSKIEAGQMEIKPEPTDISQLIQDIQHIFQQKAAQKGVRLRVILGTGLPKALLLDEVRLRQILFNLVGNALKFTDRGHVDIEVACVPHLCPSGKQAVDLEISVVDTGIGIAEADQQRIFHAFTQSYGQSNRRFGGTGLGLAITYRLTRLMGGTIDVQSQLGQGSTFTCRFTAVPIATCLLPAPTAVTAENDLNQLPTLTILVADDAKSNLDLIAGYFRNTDHRLLFAMNGQQAVRLAQAHTPDLILLDLRMPLMSGQEAATQLRQQADTRSIPIILITASSQREDDTAIDPTLYEGLLYKPLKQQQLADTIRQVLDLADLPTVGAAPVGVPSRQATPMAARGAASAHLTPLQQADLLAHLREIAVNSWTVLRQTLDIHSLETFITLLRQTIADYPYPPLADYVHKLETQLERFDWAQLPRTVNAFEALIEALNAQVKDLFQDPAND